MNSIVLLGPQRDEPTVAAALERAGSGRNLAVITAGWQEREGELESLYAHLGDVEMSDLRLYERTEEVFRQDRELLVAWRQRQDWLKEMQRIYRIRLRHAMAAERELNARDGVPALIERGRNDALTAVRELDRHHLRDIRRIHFQHWRRWKPAQRPVVARHREQIEAIIAGADTVLIAGGHVGILLNRMRLYDLGPLLTGKTLIAWSAGAMALSQRVVLFHDFAPQTPGYAEIMDAGLGACRGVVALPDARHRLAVDDAERIALLARRMSPAVSMTLEEESVLVWDGRDWRAAGATRALSSHGGLEDIPA